MVRITEIVSTKDFDFDGTSIEEVTDLFYNWEELSIISRQKRLREAVKLYEANKFMTMTDLSKTLNIPYYILRNVIIGNIKIETVGYTRGISKPKKMYYYYY